MQELKEALTEWDGVHTEVLKEVYQSHSHHPDFFPLLIQWMWEEPELQIPCTWLIKHHYDNKGHLEVHLIEPLVVPCEELSHWEAQLHLLQLLPHLPLKASYMPQLEGFVRRNLESPRPFLRAWAYQGLYELSELTPSLKPELARLCREALESEKASVKARVRKIVKKL